MNRFEKNVLIVLFACVVMMFQWIWFLRFTNKSEPIVCNPSENQQQILETINQIQTTWTDITPITNKLNKLDKRLESIDRALAEIDIHIQQ